LKSDERGTFKFGYKLYLKGKVTNHSTLLKKSIILLS